ncbi:hypothetical protein GCM10008025_07570 [Ornithinibacillus halotolerans]|uniref:Uncharacterized protein n=1 Tax=Ornithinibacillus halotolerans TaxID=1274357 RepID=A0A916RRK5_9BACI|nr:hypothetical protein GCM10008025_07570 [Ornithinibacillus halotolerans]
MLGNLPYVNENITKVNKNNTPDNNQRLLRTLSFLFIIKNPSHKNVEKIPFIQCIPLDNNTIIAFVNSSLKRYYQSDNSLL